MAQTEFTIYKYDKDNITAKTYEELPSYPLYTRNFNDSKLSNCRIYISKLDFNK